LNYIKIIESEDAPEGLIVPVFGIKIGHLRKLYFSMEIFSDMYVYPFSFRMHYVFDNYFSNIMLGLFYGSETSVDYFGYSGKIEYLFYNQIFFQYRAIYAIMIKIRAFV